MNKSLFWRKKIDPTGMMGMEQGHPEVKERREAPSALEEPLHLKDQTQEGIMYN